MSENSTETTTTVTAETTEKPAETTAPEAAQQNVEDLPQWARDALTKANKEAAGYRTKLKESEPKLKQFEALEEASKSELEKAQEQARVASEKVQAATSRAVRGEVKAIAAASFADPEDAAAFLDLGGYVSEDGEIDTARITTDLTDLLARKPHLARVQGPRLPGHNPALGSSAGGAPNLDDQIAEAQKAGDTKRAIHLQNQKLAARSGG